MLHITRNVRMLLYNNISKYEILIVWLIGIIIHHSKNKAKIDNGLKYVIQSLGVCCNNLWLLPLTKNKLSDYFDDIKIIAEVLLASVQNRHQG